MTSRELAVSNLPPVRRASSSETNVGFYERLASATGGPLLALYGLSRGSAGGLALAATGGYLFYRGMTGHCPAYSALSINTAPQSRSGPLRVEKSVTIDRPAGELYAFWRDFANLPRFMKHLAEVRVEDDDCSHWVATGPAGTTVEWDAEITLDRPDEMICWRSLPGAQVANAGCVRFQPAPAGRGTVVRVMFDYEPPAGALGAAVAWLFGEEPNQQVAGDLRRFKSIIETGEIPTTTGQPEGRRSAIGKLLKPEQKPAGAEQALAAQGGPADRPSKPVQPRKPPVTEASEQSFPASDPPAWTGAETGNREREAGA